jgi:hypothetical protein
MAAPCAGFTDVDTSSSFCGNVEWLKNRGVTLGCTATTYCPADAVTRLSMAAFLNRLGNALTPIDLRTTSFAFGIFDIDTNPVLCSTPAQAITGAPRMAHGELVFGTTGAGDVDLAVEIVESTDGVTWTAASPAQITTLPQGQSESLSVAMGPRPLAVGTSYRYAARLGRAPGSSTTGDAGPYGCHLRVTLENRNSQTPPFDE